VRTRSQDGSRALSQALEWLAVSSHLQLILTTTISRWFVTNQIMFALAYLVYASRFILSLCCKVPPIKNTKQTNNVPAETHVDVWFSRA
jgi:hypothetical protein